MSQPSPDARAVVRALDALTTQVKRITEEHVRRLTEARPTPVAVAFDAPTTADDGARCVCGDPLKWYTAPGGGAGWVHDPAPGMPILDVHKPRPADGQAPAADEDALRIARRDSLLVLLSRVRRGRVAITPDEGALLQQHVEAEMRDADTARAVAAGNLRHVQTIVPDMDRLARENEQLRAGRETWKAKAEEIERDRDRIAAELEKLRTILEYEHKRANDAIDREETAEQAVEEQRRRAESAERELHTLRAGLRANGADPTQLQNLWAQISLRNRQWRDTKRELRLTRSMLEEEGGDVSVVDEIIGTVEAAEGKTREAEATIERAHTAADLWAPKLLPRSEAHRLLTDLRAALDGTEQPTTEEPEPPAGNLAAYQAAIARVVLVLREAREHREQTDPSERQDCIMCGADHFAEIRDAIKGKPPTTEA